VQIKKWCKLARGLKLKWIKQVFFCIEVHKELSTLFHIFCFNFYFILLYSFLNFVCTEYLPVSLYHWSCRGLNAQQAWLNQLHILPKGSMNEFTGTMFSCDTVQCRKYQVWKIVCYKLPILKWTSELQDSVVHNYVSSLTELLLLTFWYHNLTLRSGFLHWHCSYHSSCLEEPEGHCEVT
jgi:hypothetical protein